MNVCLFICLYVIEYVFVLLLSLHCDGLLVVVVVVLLLLLLLLLFLLLFVLYLHVLQRLFLVVEHVLADQMSVISSACFHLGLYHPSCQAHVQFKRNSFILLHCV